MKIVLMKYPNENDSEDTERNKCSVIPYFLSYMLLNDEIAGSMNSLS